MGRERNNILDVIDRRNQRDAPIHERITLGSRSSRRNMNERNEHPREDFPPLRGSPREDNYRNTSSLRGSPREDNHRNSASPREGDAVSKDREIAELRKQIDSLQRERRGETNLTTPDDDQSKNGERAQRGPNHNNPVNQEEIRTYIQTAMETLQGFVTQLSLQTNTGMTHSDKL